MTEQSFAPTSPARLQLGVVKAALITMGISLGLTVQAAPQTDPPRSGETKELRRNGPDDRHGARRLDMLHGQLNLDANQESLWKTAKELSESSRQEMRDNHHEQREKLRKVLDSQSPDLRALAADMDKERDARQQKQKTVREAWLRFYDALNAEQKQQASRFLLAQVTMADMMPGGRGGNGPGSGPHGPRRTDERRGPSDMPR